MLLEYFAGDTTIGGRRKTFSRCVISSVIPRELRHSPPRIDPNRRPFYRAFRAPAAPDNRVALECRSAQQRRGK